MSKSQRQAFYDDVLTTAVEGGINYWAECRGYRWSDDGPTTADVRDAGYEDDGPGEWKHLTRASMVEAFSVLRSDKPLALHSSYRERINQAWRAADAGDIDTTDADIVVQVAVLGDVIYG